MHTDTVAASVNEDRLAIDVYQYAETAGERITLGLVDRRLDELRTHDPDCGCGLCAAAHAARAQGVYYVAPSLGRRDRGDQVPAGRAFAEEHFRRG